jgi:transmembrane sensor
MSESEKLKFIHAYLTGDISSPDGHVFDNWLNSDPENLILYKQVSEIWQSASPPEAIAFDYNKAYNKHLNELSASETKITFVNKSNHWVGMAASIAATFLVLIAILVLFKGEDQIVKADDIAQLHVLPDGSKAWLNKNAVLSYEEFNDSKRKVSVSGVVFFEVTPNKSTPFIITTDEFEIKVVGTKFLVNTVQSSVAVKEGIVDVKNSKSTQRLTKDQKVELTSDGEMKPSTALFDSSQLWFNDDLVFKNTPFDRVIKDLSDNFNIIIKIPAKDTWSECTFTSGSLKTSSLEQILEILKLTYDLEYSKQKDNSIKLTSVKCR